MQRSPRVAALFALFVVGLGGWLLLARRDSPEPAGTIPSSSAMVPPGADSLASVPDGALVVLTLDVRALRRTPIGDRLLGRGRRIPGLGLLSEVCGNDPLENVDGLVFVIPARSADGDFGVVATGRLEADALLRCAREIITRRGGQPDVQQRGRYRVMHERAGAPDAAALAVAEHGPAIVGPPSFVDRAVALGESDARADRHTDHLLLRAQVRPGFAIASVVLTDELRRTLVEELTAQGAPSSPWAAATGAAASFAIDDRIHLEVVLRCDPAAACVGLEREVRSTFESRARRFEGLLPELARALGAVRVVGQPGTLRLSLDLIPERAIGLVEELLALSELGRRTTRDGDAPLADGGAGGGAGADSSTSAGSTATPEGARDDPAPRRGGAPAATGAPSEAAPGPVPGPAPGPSPTATAGRSIFDQRQ